MTLTRYDPPGGLYYDTAALPANTTTTLCDFSTAAPTTIVAGDECFVLWSQYIVASGSINIPNPTGWTYLATTPSDLGLGSVAVTRIFYRRADGTSDDYPVFEATHSGSTTDREVRVTGSMWCYRGDRLEFYSTGSVGSSGGRGGPTDAFTVSCPANSLFIGAAYQIINDTTPSLSTAHGFTRFWYYNPSGSALPASHAVADQFYVSGTVDGPEWSVSRGSSTSEHHDVWLVMKKVNPAGLVKGRRIGQAGGLVRVM